MRDGPSQFKDQRSKTKDQIAAIILAAGRSSRMGAFKPLLPFGNGTVIDACIDSLRTAGVEEIVIVIGNHAEDLRDHLKTKQVTVASNPDPDSAMSVSIALGVPALSASARAVLITPADHPAVPPKTIRTLIETWRNGAKLIQPEFEGKGGHPVLIDLEFRAELLKLDTSTGLRGLFTQQRQQVLRLPVQSPFVARDMDTWDDYTRLHEAVFGRKPPGK